MKRGYTALEYKSTVRKLRAVRPGISLSSDFIVGFPGRDRRRLRADDEAVDDVGFDGAFSFLYSPRPGTPAAELADQVPRRVAAGAPRARCRRCSTRSTARTARRWSARASACWSPAAPRKDASELAGRTDNNRVVNFAGDAALVGTLRRRRRSPPRWRTRCAANSSTCLNAPDRRPRAAIEPIRFRGRVHDSSRYHDALCPAATRAGHRRRPAPGRLRDAARGCADTAKRPNRGHGGRRRDRRREGRRGAGRRARAGAPAQRAPGAPRRRGARLQPPPRPPPRSPKPFAEVIKDAKETPGLFRVVAEGREGLDRDRARPVRRAVLLHVEPEPRRRRAGRLRRHDACGDQIVEFASASATPCS